MHYLFGIILTNKTEDISTAIVEVMTSLNDNGRELSHTFYSDVMSVKECLDSTCEHIIIAKKNSYDSEFNAAYILRTSARNGDTFQDTAWDGKIGSAIEMFRDKMIDYSDEYNQQFNNIENWLFVIVNRYS